MNSFIEVLHKTSQTQQIVTFLKTEDYANNSNVEKLRQMFVIERERLREIKRTFYLDGQTKLTDIERQSQMLNTIALVGKIVVQGGTTLFV